MLWKLRRHARPLLRPMLALAVLLWLATAIAPCFQPTAHCDGMDGTTPCAHAAATTDCDTACLRDDSRDMVAANFTATPVVPALLAVAVLIVPWPVTRTASVTIRRRRTPDTPLHLQFARLLI